MECGVGCKYFVLLVPRLFPLFLLLRLRLFLLLRPQYVSFYFYCSVLVLCSDDIGSLRRRATVGRQGSVVDTKRVVMWFGSVAKGVTQCRVFAGEPRRAHLGSAVVDNLITVTPR